MKASWVAAMILCGGVAVAQDPIAWLKKSWATVNREGKAAADRLIKESPARFKDIKKQAATVSKKAESSLAGLDLEGKTRVITELWRVRSSINLLSLANPNTLSLVGIDPDQVIAMTKQLDSTWATVARDYPEILKSLRFSK